MLETLSAKVYISSGGTVLDKSQVALDAYKVSIKETKSLLDELRAKMDAFGLNPPAVPSVQGGGGSGNFMGLTLIPAKENFLGGRIQKFAEGGFVNGPAGRDQVPAMLTAGEYVVPKDEVQKFNNGTGRAGAESTGNWWEEGVFGWNRSNSNNRGTAAFQGAARLGTMQAVSQYMSSSSNRSDDKPPEFDMKKLNQLNLKSDVSMKRGDRRLSAKALAKDPVMQEYKNHLMDKSAYNVRKTNERYQEKLQRKMAFVTLGQGMIMSGAIDTFVSPVVRKVGDLARKGAKWVGRKTENTVKGSMGFGEYSDAFKSARRRGYDVDYKDVANSFKTGDPIGVHTDNNYVSLKPRADFTLTDKAPYYNVKQSWDVSGIDKHKAKLVKNLYSSYEY